MRFFTKLRDFLVYLAILIPYKLLRIMPYCAVKGVAWICGCAMNLIPSIRKLVRANIRTAFPEYSAAEVAAVARRSLHNLALNMAEFVWLNGRSDRIERCYVLPEDITERLKGHVARKERIIFVNPHLGSWEASGVMAPYYAGVDMVAIAKPVRNPYLNRLLNSGKCHYATLFELKGKGRIAISIVESGYMQPRLGIVYVNQDEISHQRLQMFRDI